MTGRPGDSTIFLVTTACIGAAVIIMIQCMVPSVQRIEKKGSFESLVYTSIEIPPVP